MRVTYRQNNFPRWTVISAVRPGRRAVALAVAGCGSSGAKVGDCINAQKRVVGCGSSDAKLKLVTKESGPTAIACVEIGNQPQIQVKVQGTDFCAVRR